MPRFVFILALCFALMESLMAQTSVSLGIGMLQENYLKSPKIKRNTYTTFYPVRGQFHRQEKYFHTSVGFLYFRSKYTYRQLHQYQDYSAVYLPSASMEYHRETYTKEFAYLGGNCRFEWSLFNKGSVQLLLGLRAEFQALVKDKNSGFFTEITFVKPSFTSPDGQVFYPGYQMTTTTTAPFDRFYMAKLVVSHGPSASVRMRLTDNMWLQTSACYYTMSKRAYFTHQIDQPSLPNRHLSIETSLGYTFLSRKK